MRLRSRVALFGTALALTATTTTVVLAARGSGSDGAIVNARAADGHHQHTGQHGEIAGHLDATNDNVRVVSKLALKNVEPGKIADVGVHKGYAYLAAWGGETCKYNGIHVVDIRDIANPKEVAFIASKEGSAAGEGVQALAISTPQFTGDILVSNNEICKDKAGFGGLNIYNVTKPGSPALLAEGFGDETVPGQGKKAANEIHSIFAWDAGEKAYAVIVDNEEAADVDIVDISNPRKPKMVAEYDLAAPPFNTGQDAPSNLTQVFSHDMIVKQIGGRWVMSMSYWDGGYVLLDVTNPANATLISESDFPAVDAELLAATGTSAPPEGNAHQSEFTTNNDFLIASDEDFGPYSLRASMGTAPGTPFTAVPGDGPQIAAGTTLSGTTRYVGLACPGSTIPPADGATIAVAARGVCLFAEKIATVEAANAGYTALVVVDRVGSDACVGLRMAIGGGIPSFSVDRATGFDLFGLSGFDLASCLAGNNDALTDLAVGTGGASIAVQSYFDGWGYVRLFKNPLVGGANGLMTEVDTYAIPEAMDPACAAGHGDLSVHEVAVSEATNNRAYLSYYSGGVRVIEIEGDKIVEVGRFVDEGGSNFWGVQTFKHSDGKEYVAASDRDLGLYILEYTPGDYATGRDACT